MDSSWFSLLVSRCRRFWVYRFPCFRRQRDHDTNYGRLAITLAPEVPGICRREARWLPPHLILGNQLGWEEPPQSIRHLNVLKPMTFYMTKTNERRRRLCTTYPSAPKLLTRHELPTWIGWRQLSPHGGRGFREAHFQMNSDRKVSTATTCSIPARAGGLPLYRAKWYSTHAANRSDGASSASHLMTW
jgi:hypothetical protein